MTDLPTMTPLERERLLFYLCDPFLTFEEALKLAGIRRDRECKSEERLAA